MVSILTAGLKSGCFSNADNSEIVSFYHINMQKSIFKYT